MRHLLGFVGVVHKIGHLRAIADSALYLGIVSGWREAEGLGGGSALAEGLGERVEGLGGESHGPGGRGGGLGRGSGWSGCRMRRAWAKRVEGWRAWVEEAEGWKKAKRQRQRNVATCKEFAAEEFLLHGD